MPLRVNNGLPIAVEPLSTSELLSGFLNRDATVLPEEILVGPATPPRLDVRPIRQLQDMWCWAACARMVLLFFGEPLEQCQIVSRFVGRLCCGDSSSSSDCDIGLPVSEINQAFGLAGLAGRHLERTVSFEEVSGQINGTPESPIVAGVKWAGGGGHVVVISGCRIVNGIRYLRVNDPFYGPGDIRYSDLLDRYGRNNTGKWLHTWLDFSKP